MNPVNFIVNIAFPVVVLLTLSSPDRLGSVPALLLAIGIPAIYGIYTLWRSHRIEPTALLGIISVLATGVIGVFELNTRLFAFKEAAIPIGFAALLIFSNSTRFPISTLLADMVQRREKVLTALHAVNREDRYHRHLQRVGSLWASFMLLSGVLKFLLASFIVRASAGTEAFNHQLAQYELWQLPTTFTLTGVLIMSLISYLGTGTAAITGLTTADVYRGGQRTARVAEKLQPIAKLFGSTPTA